MPVRDLGPRPVNGSLRRSTLWLTLGALGGALLPLVQTPVFFRTLTAPDFGLWAMGAGVGAAISALDLGLGAATGTFVSVAAGQRAWRQVRRVTTASVALGCAFIALIGAGALAAEPPITRLLRATYPGQVVLSDFYWATVALVVVSIFAIIGRAALSGLSRFRLVGMTQFLVQVATTVVTSAAAVRGAPVPVLLWLTAAGVLVQGLLLIAMTYGVTIVLGSIRETARSSRSSLLRLLRFSGWMQATGITTFLNSQTDRLVIAGVAGTGAVAPYEAANTAVRMLRLVPTQMLIAAMPALASAAEESQTALRAVYDDAVRQVARYALNLGGLTLAVAPVAYEVWLGKVPPYALSMTVALVLASSCNLLTGPGTAVLRTIGRPGLEVAYNALLTVLNLGLSILLGLLYGAWGVVIATAIATAATSLGFLLVFRRLTDLSLLRRTRKALWSTWLGTTVVGLGLMTASHSVQVQTSDTAALLLTLVVGGILYASASLLWDRDLVHGLANRLRRGAPS